MRVDVLVVHLYTCEAMLMMISIKECLFGPSCLMTDAIYIGYESLVDELSTLVSISPPPFIYINDPTSPRLTSAILSTLFKSFPSTSLDPGPSSRRVHYAQVNAIACFTPRLFFDNVVNALTEWTPDWELGCANWGHETERWNEHFDSFLHGLRAARKYLQDRSKGKGKEKARGQDYDDVRFVIVVERAERLKENLPELIVPLTRLAELVCAAPVPKFALLTHLAVPTRSHRAIPLSSTMGRHPTSPRCISRSVLHRHGPIAQRK